MIRKLFTNSLISSLVVTLLLSSTVFAQENDSDKYRMMYYFTTTKKSDNTRLLEARLIGRNKKDRKDKIPVYDAEIKFYNFLDEAEELLGSTKTSEEGIASITLAEDQQYLVDEAGLINLKAIFEGSDAIDEQIKEIAVRDVFLELDLTEIDSIKTVVVKAFTLDSLGVETPVAEADLNIAVGGMLSKMKIEEGSIDDGEFEYEFPTDLPGDMNGDLIVYAIIEDHEEFANVEQQKSMNWGVFNKQEAKKGNTLWSKAAPIWMYVVLTILLVGVWMNYGYTILNLFKIRKEGRELEEEAALETED